MNKQNYFNTRTGAWRVILVLFATVSFCMGGTGTKQSEKGEPQVKAKAPVTKAVDQTEIGLRKEKLLGEAGVVDAVKPVGKKPGENEKYNRTYAAPPMIPHTAAEYLPIKAGANDCLSCHTKPSKKWIKAGTPILTDFHRTDREGKMVRKKTGIYMGFYNCSTCHNVMTDAKPLVENTFSSK